MNDDDTGIIDYTTHYVAPVTTDGPAQRATLMPTRSVPYRTSAPERDKRSEADIRSTIEGLQEKVARLEAGMSFLLQERHEAAQLVQR